MKLFFPRSYQPDIFHINYSKLKDMGYKILIFDLDNTLAKIKEEKPNLETIKLLNTLALDFQIIIASNSHKKRVLNFSKNINCDYIYFSLKPTLRSLRKIKKKYQVPYQKMVIIGDQVVTDILVGNRKGLMTILVDPKENYDLKITGFNRKMEKIINRINKIEKGKYYE